MGISKGCSLCCIESSGVSEGGERGERLHATLRHRTDIRGGGAAIADVTSASPSRRRTMIRQGWHQKATMTVP